MAAALQATGGGESVCVCVRVCEREQVSVEWRHPATGCGGGARNSAAHGHARGERGHVHPEPSTLNPKP